MLLTLKMPLAGPCAVMLAIEIFFIGSLINIYIDNLRFGKNFDRSRDVGNTESETIFLVGTFGKAVITSRRPRTRSDGSVMPPAPGSNRYVGLGDMVTLEHACFALDKPPDDTHLITPHLLSTSQTTENCIRTGERCLHVFQQPCR